MNRKPKNLHPIRLQIFLIQKINEGLKVSQNETVSLNLRRVYETFMRLRREREAQCDNNLEF